MSAAPRRRLLPVPANWTTLTGLAMTGRGLHGTVLVSDGHEPAKILCFECVNVIEVSTDDWSTGEVIQCVATLATPKFADPWLRSLAERDLLPLLACGSLCKMDVLRLLSMVPTWQP